MEQLELWTTLIVLMNQPESEISLQFFRTEEVLRMRAESPVTFDSSSEDAQNNNRTNRSETSCSSQNSGSKGSVWTEDLRSESDPNSVNQYSTYDNMDYSS